MPCMLTLRAPDGVLRGTLCQGPATASGAPELTQVNGQAECTGDDQFYFVGNAGWGRFEGNGGEPSAPRRSPARSVVGASMPESEKLAAAPTGAIRAIATSRREELRPAALDVGELERGGGRGVALAGSSCAENARNAAFAERLTAHGVPTDAADG